MHLFLKSKKKKRSPKVESTFLTSFSHDMVEWCPSPIPLLPSSHFFHPTIFPPCYYSSVVLSNSYKVKILLFKCVMASQIVAMVEHHVSNCQGIFTISLVILHWFSFKDPCWITSLLPVVHNSLHLRQQMYQIYILFFLTAMYYLIEFLYPTHFWLESDLFANVPYGEVFCYKYRNAGCFLVFIFYCIGYFPRVG